MSKHRKLQEKLFDALCGHPVVFHHVPKCGGTSIGNALRRRYFVSSERLRFVSSFRAIAAQNPESDVNETERLVDDFLDKKLLCCLNSGIRCVIGHVRFGMLAHENFGDRYRFVTTLRDPISLMLSHFAFQKKRKAGIWEVAENLEHYLETDEARHIGTVLPYYFSGLGSDVDRNSAESLEHAKRNLKKLSAVGFVEDMGSFERRLSDVLGIRVRIGHANRSAVRSDASSQAMTPQIRRKLEVFNAANYEIYEFAKREFAR